MMWCFDLLKSGYLVVRDSDGKLENGPASQAWDVPWHFVVAKGVLNCQLWSKVMFSVIFKKLPKEITGGKIWVPIGCQNCWKVVARPKTLKQLFAVVDLQKRLGYHAKCGIEHRAHVFGLYGAYWYNRSQEEGIEKYKLVRKAIDEDPLLGPDVSVILKRGCTEMELSAGRSDEYEITDVQRYVEDLINECFNTDIINRKQPPWAVDYVHARWIEYAYQWGDETALEFLSPDRPMYTPLVTYHHLAEEGQDASGGQSGNPSYGGAPDRQEDHGVIIGSTEGSGDPKKNAWRIKTDEGDLKAVEDGGGYIHSVGE